MRLTSAFRAASPHRLPAVSAMATSGRALSAQRESCTSIRSQMVSVAQRLQPAVAKFNEEHGTSIPARAS